MPSVLQRIAKFRTEAEDAFWGLVNEVTTVVATLTVFVLVGRNMGLETYGAYLGVFGAATIFQPFSGTGGIPMTIYEAVVRDGEDPMLVTRSAVSLTLIGNALLLAPAIVFAADTASGAITWYVAAIFVINMLTIQGLTFVLTAVTQATDGFRFAAKLRTLSQVMRATPVVALAALGQLTIRNFAVASCIFLLAQLAIVYRRAVRSLGGRLILPGHPHRRHLLSSATYSVELTAVSFLSGFPLVALNQHGYRESAGLYGAATRILNLGSAPLRAAQASTHMMFLERRRNKVNLALRLTPICFPVMGLFALVVFFAHPLFPVVLGDDFDGATTVIWWLLPMVTLHMMSEWPINGLMGVGRKAVRAGSRIVIGVAAIGLYSVWVPGRDWQGAVQVTTLITAITFVLAWVGLIYFSRLEPAQLARDDRAGAPRHAHPGADPPLLAARSR